MIIQLPDGRTAEFPDDMPLEEIKKILQGYGAGSSTQSAPPEDHWQLADLPPDDEAMSVDNGYSPQALFSNQTLREGGPPKDTSPRWWENGSTPVEAAMNIAKSINPFGILPGGNLPIDVMGQAIGAAPEVVAAAPETVGNFSDALNRIVRGDHPYQDNVDSADTQWLYHGPDYSDVNRESLKPSGAQAGLAQIPPVMIQQPTKLPELPKVIPAENVPKASQRVLNTDNPRQILEKQKENSSIERQIDDAFIKGLYATSDKLHKVGEEIAPPRQVPTFEYALKHPTKLPQYVAETVGQQLPVMGSIILAEIMVPGVGGPLASTAIETDQISRQTLKETGQRDPETALVGGAVSGALEYLPIGLMLARDPVVAKTFKQFALNTLKGGGIQALEEAPTEFLQTYAERLATDITHAKNGDWDKVKFFSKDTLKNALEAASAGGVVGGVMGAGHGAGHVDPRAVLEDIDKTSSPETIIAKARSMMTPEELKASLEAEKVRRDQTIAEQKENPMPVLSAADQTETPSEAIDLAQRRSAAAAKEIEIADPYVQKAIYDWGAEHATPADAVKYAKESAEKKQSDEYYSALEKKLTEIDERVKGGEELPAVEEQAAKPQERTQSVPEEKQIQQPEETSTVPIEQPPVVFREHATQQAEPQPTHVENTVPEQVPQRQTQDQELGQDQVESQPPAEERQAQEAEQPEQAIVPEPKYETTEEQAGTPIYKLKSPKLTRRIWKGVPLKKTPPGLMQHSDSGYSYDGEMILKDSAIPELRERLGIQEVRKHHPRFDQTIKHLQELPGSPVKSMSNVTPGGDMTFHAENGESLSVDGLKAKMVLTKMKPASVEIRGNSAAFLDSNGDLVAALLPTRGDVAAAPAMEAPTTPIERVIGRRKAQIREPVNSGMVIGTSDIEAEFPGFEASPLPEGNGFIATHPKSGEWIKFEFPKEIKPTQGMLADYDLTPDEFMRRGLVVSGSYGKIDGGSLIKLRDGEADSQTLHQERFRWAMDNALTSEERQELLHKYDGETNAAKAYLEYIKKDVAKHPLLKKIQKFVQKIIDIVAKAFGKRYQPNKIFEAIRTGKGLKYSEEDLVDHIDRKYKAISDAAQEPVFRRKIAETEMDAKKLEELREGAKGTPKKFEKAGDAISKWHGEKNAADYDADKDKANFYGKIGDIIGEKKQKYKLVARRIISATPRVAQAAQFMTLWSDFLSDPTLDERLHRLPKEWQERYKAAEKYMERYPKLKHILNMILEHTDNIGDLALKEGIISRKIGIYLPRFITNKESDVTFGLSNELGESISSSHARHRLFKTRADAIIYAYEHGKPLPKYEDVDVVRAFTRIRKEINAAIENRKLKEKLEGVFAYDAKGKRQLESFGHETAIVEHSMFEKKRFAGTVEDKYEKTPPPQSVDEQIGETQEKKKRKHQSALDRANSVKGQEIINRRYFFVVDGKEQEFTDLNKAVQALEKVNAGREAEDKVDLNIRGDVVKIVKPYAPIEVARHLNNNLTASAIRQYPVLNGLLKTSTFMKKALLLLGVFHHQAFLRSYWFGSLRKGSKNFKGTWNPIKAAREGLKTYYGKDPQIKLLIRNGLTSGKINDTTWNPDLHEVDYLGRRAPEGPIKDFFDYANNNGIAKAAYQAGKNFIRQQQRFLFDEFGTGLKIMAAKIELNKQLEAYPDEDINYIARRTAGLINADFGGINLARMGRSQTKQDMLRLLMLAPDWTESNVQTMMKAIDPLGSIAWAADKAGLDKMAAGMKKTSSPNGIDFSGWKNASMAERKMYAKFWTSAIIQSQALTFLGNLIMAGFDDKSVWERYKLAWEAGNGRSLDIDMTPLYDGIYKELGKRPSGARKYVSVMGHFGDIFRMLPIIGNTTKFAYYKANPIISRSIDLITGADYRGRRFATNKQFLGLDKGYTTTGKKTGGKYKGKLFTNRYGRSVVGFAQALPSLIYLMKSFLPLPVQSWGEVATGESEGWDGALRSLGVYAHTTRPEFDLRVKELLGPEAPFGKYINIANTYGAKSPEATEFLAKNSKKIRAGSALKAYNSQIAAAKRRIYDLQKSKTKDVEARIKAEEDKIDEYKKKFLKKYSDIMQGRD